MSEPLRTATIKNETELEVMREAGTKVVNIVSGERNKCYGTPSENHSITGSMWALFLSRKFGFPIVISASDVCWMNMLQKASRQAHWPQYDNGIDVAGYALNSLACDHAQTQEQQRSPETLQRDHNNCSRELHPKASSIQVRSLEQGRNKQLI